MYTTEFLDIPPLSAAQGTLRLPGSKSISNRVLLLAGLSAGVTQVGDVLSSDDTRVMLNALRLLGCDIQSHGNASRSITGLAGQLQTRQATLFLGNAGTAMRPLTAVLALLSASQGGVFELTGIPRMYERPIADLINALRPLGCHIECLGQEGYPPLRLKGGRLDLSQPIRVRGDVSSQFLTALLLALPLVTQDQALTIEVEGELISKPYIEITLNLLQRFGVQVRREGWQRFYIPQHSRYQTPGFIPVEGDASSASYFIAAGALAAEPGKPIRIEGIGAQSIQGDIRFIEAAQAMGAHISAGPNYLEVCKGQWPLQALDLDCNHIPDAAMTLAIMALYAQGTTRLTNIASWRVKETDRIAAMANELTKLGARVEAGPDFIAITPPASLSEWRSASIHTYDDHRMAMCFSLAAFNGLLVPELNQQPNSNALTPTQQQGVKIRIEDPQCVAKTFPDYFETFFRVVQARPADIPVITIDGPTASGKGTLASALAERLGFHLLDSGSIYRAVALAALEKNVAAHDEKALAELATQLDLRFATDQIWLNGQEVKQALRQERVSMLASQVAAWPAVRQAVLALQQAFRQLPGLVADGRDMGTVVFPQAQLKVFLTASAATRAERRYNQLITNGFCAKLEELLVDLEARDLRDQTRTVAPLKPAAEAYLLDNSHLSIDESVDKVLGWWQDKR